MFDIIGFEFELLTQIRCLGGLTLAIALLAPMSHDIFPHMTKAQLQHLNGRCLLLKIYYYFMQIFNAIETNEFMMMFSSKEIHNVL